MNIPIKYTKKVFVMDEDGYFQCPHEDYEIIEDDYGDTTRIIVRCDDCNDEDLSDSFIDKVIEDYYRWGGNDCED